MNSQNQRKKLPIQRTSSQTKEWIKSLLTSIGIALLIRATIIYPYTIPTGSMEKTLKVGDYILANKFVHGIRTPDWIGIPYTKIGFNVPCTRLPGIRQPQQGDVVVFKHPRDREDYWVKRCIAVSGDEIKIVDNRVFVNDKEFLHPPHSQFIAPRNLPENFQQKEIFPVHAGNIHQYGPVRIPKPGDKFHFTEENRDQWADWFQLIYFEGNKILFKTGKKEFVYNGHKREAWQKVAQTQSIQNFYINGKALTDFEYTVQDKQYFMMGDNRDNSSDSRYWGFVPERYIVAEPIVIWWSWDKELPFYRLADKVRWDRLLTVVR